MSFGDIAPSLPATPAGLALPAISELQRLLKPLAANNSALRQAAGHLSSNNPEAPVHLKRVRALREQNRQIARAAATLSSSVDVQVVGRQPDVIEKANHAKREFQQLLDDFSTALTESITAERTYIENVTNRDTATIAAAYSDGLSESQVAIEQDRLAHHAPSENDPLLARTRIQSPREAAALREIQSNEDFVQERRIVLADVQSSIDDVNAIFKDLAVMITDQRTQVEHVEIAIGETAHNVSGARRELEKTQKRREARKRFFFVTLLSIAGIIALFLIFLLS